MHHALKKVLQRALPRMVGGSVMVADELLESGGDEAFTRYLRRHLSNILADFIVDSKVLDGSDASCFTMVPDEKLAATRCEAKLHVLTPKELEALVAKAFAAGVNVGREAESYGPKPYIPRDPPPWPSPKFSREDLEKIMQIQWKEAFDDLKPPRPGEIGKKP